MRRYANNLTSPQQVNKQSQNGVDEQKEKTQSETSENKRYNSWEFVLQMVKFTRKLMNLDCFDKINQLDSMGNELNRIMNSMGYIYLQIIKLSTAAMND